MTEQCRNAACPNHTETPTPAAPPLSAAIEDAFWFGEHLKCDVPCQDWAREIRERDAVIRAEARAQERERIREYFLESARFNYQLKRFTDSHALNHAARIVKNIPDSFTPRALSQPQPAARQEGEQHER